MKDGFKLPPTTWLKLKISNLGYKPVHRYAVILLQNSRFYVKFNRVAVDPFIALDVHPQI